MFESHLRSLFSYDIWVYDFVMLCFFFFSYDGNIVMVNAPPLSQTPRAMCICEQWNVLMRLNWIG
jgi:hypothetical protein